MKKDRLFELLSEKKSIYGVSNRNIANITSNLLKHGFKLTTNKFNDICLTNLWSQNSYYIETELFENKKKAMELVIKRLFSEISGTVFSESETKEILNSKSIKKQVKKISDILL